MCQARGRRDEDQQNAHLYLLVLAFLFEILEDALSLCSILPEKLSATVKSHFLMQLDCSQMLPSHSSLHLPSTAPFAV